MMRNRAGWLALIVLAIASLLMVFVVMPRINQDAKPAADAINAAGDAVKNAVTDRNSPPDASKPSEQAAATPAAPAAQPASPATEQPAPAQSDQTTAKEGRVVSPSFDILRVEPDGSTVIAGRAEPNSKLEVTNGAAVVAKVDVGPAGDFAAVLDNPLPPGDHQLVLKAIGKDGKALLSEETATVSVPVKGSADKLLAMVTTPGKASRIIAAPTADTGTPAAQDTASASPAPANGTASQASDASQATAAPEAAGTPAQPATAEAPAVPASSSANDVVAALPAPPAGSEGLANSAPSIPGSAPAAPVAPAAPATPAAEGAAAALRVTAVEIEGSKIFIAGQAKPGASLRGLANGRAIGTAHAGSNGSFVIEGTGDLAVGDHTITVETLGAGGAVALRVEVPFNRPAGEQVAAVASAEPGTDPLATVDAGAYEKLRTDTVRAFNLLQGLYDGGRTPDVEEMTAARSSTVIALRSLSEYRLPADAAASTRVLAQATAQNAAAALEALEALPRDVGAVGASLKEISELVARTVGPALAQNLQRSEPGAPAVAQSNTGNSNTAPNNGAASNAGTASSTTADAGNATTPTTIQQAPLTQSQRASVIIRRGDTLWQISRRVYGQGVRYTTIYLANEEQIRNPDIIQPGQIFGVPEEYRPDAEEIHRRRMQQRRG
ncbi:peptidoglycan-binding protein LysM [Neorhizobium sp. SOG26]|uniref:LysM peptidoglycan-binding domain-containing protein n=1 Tax=Neorhizobium sp. SOG26 TaxID=2060726 RepID=UPI000E581067|nr:LysM peptidoglycan-binding domain-containing protein [Neorhizobium sp. SOG26]AXV14863.1 peptidoglycan-binding protein LysM [Neorhizobium sp. SOG26]